MAGAIAGSKEHYNELWFTRQAIGTTLDAYSASLLERGLKTFELRAEAMAARRQAMAEFLADHPKVSRLSVSRVWPSDPGHEVAARQMHAASAACWPSTSGEDEDDAKRFIAALKTIYPRRQPRGDRDADLHPLPDDHALPAAGAAHDLRRPQEHGSAVGRHRAAGEADQGHQAGARLRGAGGDAEWLTDESRFWWRTPPAGAGCWASTACRSGSSGTASVSCLTRARATSCCNNARRLGIGLDQIDAVVFSHGHYDHTGGLGDVLRSSRATTVYAHPAAFDAKYARNPDGSRP